MGVLIFGMRVLGILFDENFLDMALPAKTANITFFYVYSIYLFDSDFFLLPDMWLPIDMDITEFGEFKYEDNDLIRSKLRVSQLYRPIDTNFIYWRIKMWYNFPLVDI